MSTRSAFSASIAGAVLVVGFIGRLLAQRWLYLLIGGVLVLLGWMVVVLARRARASPSLPQPAPVEKPRADPSGAPYRTLLTLDPAAFDEPSRAEAAAREAFGAWARTWPTAPERPAEFVRSVEVRTRYVGRLATTLSERQLEARTAPHRGSRPVTAPRLPSSAVDPWAFSPESLREASLYVGSCPSCESSGRVPCLQCGGSSRIKCPHCNGSRKAYGLASNGSRRLMNCKPCAATGEVDCTACSEGRAACATCGGSGRLEHWLAFVETDRNVAYLALDGEELRAFPWSAAGPEVSLDAINADGKFLGEVTAQGMLDEKAVEFAPRPWLRANWLNLQPAVRHGERVKSQTFCAFELPHVLVSYSLDGAAPSRVEFEGRRMLVPATPADPSFEAHARKVRLARWAALVVGVGVPFVYLLRGSYFWNASVGALILCVGVAAVAGERFVREATLGRWAGARRWIVASAAPALVASGLAVVSEPGLRTVEQYLAAGRLEKARMELDALGEPGEQSHARAWAALRLASAQRSNDVATVASYAMDIPVEFPERASAEERLYDVTQHAVQEQLDHKDLNAAQATLARATPVIRVGAKGAPVEKKFAALLAQVKDAEFAACETDACRWKTAFESARAVSSEEREQRLKVAQTKLTESLDARPGSNEPALSRLKRFDDVGALAKVVREAPGDEALQAKAQAAVAWSREERRKIPTLGAERAVAAELLGIPVGTDTARLGGVISSVSTYCWIKAGRCVGIYLVGSEKGARSLNDHAHTEATTGILSQALGHPMALPPPPGRVGGKVPTLSRWRDGGVPLVARWRDSDLVELRIGEGEL